MDAVEPHLPSRGADLLLEHVNALDPGEFPQRPAARERLERMVGGYLARLLVGALSSSRCRHRPLD
jgi:hypothetical protein